MVSAGAATLQDSAARLAQNAAKIYRCNDANTLIRFQLPKVAIAGDDQPSVTSNGTLQNAVVVIVRMDHLQRELGHDESRRPHQELHCWQHTFIAPRELQPEDTCKLCDDIRRQQQLEAALDGSLPNLKRDTGAMCERRNQDVGVQHHSKTFGSDGTHGRDG